MQRLSGEQFGNVPRAFGRVAAVVVALVVGLAPGAGASPNPRWPCGPITVHVGDGPAHDLAVQAVAQLASASGREWEVTTNGRSDVTISWDDSDGDTGGMTSNAANGDVMVRSSITLRDDLGRWEHRGILHELGHAAGLQHVSHPRSVMSTVDGKPYRDYQPSDVAALRAVGC